MQHSQIAPMQGATSTTMTSPSDSTDARTTADADTGTGDDTSSAARSTRTSASSSRKRSLLKTLSWRITATTTTFIIAWIITGDLGAGAAIGGIEAVAKMFLYYGHERAWEHVPVT